MKFSIKIAIAVVALAIAGGGWYWYASRSAESEFPQYTGPVTNVTLSHTGNPDAGLIQIALTNGYFQEEGMKTTVVQHKSGKDSLAAVLSGAVDFGVSADTPLVHAALQNKDVAILARISKPKNGEGIIARRGSGITTPADLVGKRVGLPIGTSAAYVLDQILESEHVQKSAVTLVDTAPDALQEALRTGDIDAAVIWQPWIQRIHKAFDEESIILYGDSTVNTYNFYLIARKSAVQEEPEVATRFVRSLARAERYLRTHPRSASALIEAATDVERSLMDSVYDPKNNIGLSLSQSVVLRLEEQSRWAQASGLTANQTAPNFLDYIFVDALATAQPDAMTLIH
jgi:NitT/TauT family transport system substrate-binding protein